MNIIRLAVGATMIVALSTYSSVAAAPMMHAFGFPVTIRMKPQNGSGEVGTATLRNVAGGVQVEINLANSPRGVSQPAHIHIGSCAVLNPNPYISLSPVVNGHSTTIITRNAAPRGVTIATLTRGHYAINVHRSLRYIKTYVSCGDLFGAR